MNLPPKLSPGYLDFMEFLGALAKECGDHLQINGAQCSAEQARETAELICELWIDTLRERLRNSGPMPTSLGNVLLPIWAARDSFAQLCKKHNVEPEVFDTLLRAAFDSLHPRTQLLLHWPHIEVHHWYLGYSGYMVMPYQYDY